MSNVSLPETYRERRHKLMQAMRQGIALIGASGMAVDPFLFDKNLRYLTGRDSRKGFLLLSPDGLRVQRFESIRGPELARGRIVHEVLFVEERSERQKFMDGAGPGPDQIQQDTGVDIALPLSKLNEVLHDNLCAGSLFWVNVPGCPVLDKPLNSDQILYNEIRKRFLWLEFRNVAPLIHALRRVKDAYEIDCLRHAFQVNSEIFTTIMRRLKPGDNESVGEAIWHYEAKAHYNPNDVSCEALDTYSRHIILGAGKNAAIAHYMDNCGPVREGDLVLIDAGIDYKGYSSDMTRTFPASGKFTARQRELYEIVLQAQKAAIATMKPGSTAFNAHRASFEVLTRHGLDKYGYGLAGHPVGLNMHDSNGYGAWDQDYPFEPGVVIVIEPFITIPEEGIGIRIEDGVVITDSGHELMPGAPREVADVEALCSGAATELKLRS